MSEEWHIAGLVVRVRLERMTALATELTALPGLEVHAFEAGKIVITLEASGTAAILACMAQIEELTGVLSVHLVYHQIDTAASEEENP